MTPTTSTLDGNALDLLETNARAAFITRTYIHLSAAIAGFILIETFLFWTGLSTPIARTLLEVPWLMVLGAFSVVGWLASRTANFVQSKAAQYVALSAYVVAEAIIFVPMLYLAQGMAPGIIGNAAVITLMAFAGLTAVAFVTRKNFSFLRGMLGWGGVTAIILIVAGSIFGFELGTWFSVAMIALAGASILHDTSNVLFDFEEDRYVSAALQLFGSVALLFWYVLRLLIAIAGRR